ncbi:MAG: BamA/TamA family outer membrane protein, partial [Paracoccaceae bacterium]
MKLIMGAAGLWAGFAASLAVAQDGGQAAITTGASYSSQRGSLAFIALDGKDILGSGIDLHFSYEAGSSDTSAELAIQKTWQLGGTPLGSDSFVALRLGGSKSDIEAQQFALDQRSVDLTFGAALGQSATYAVSLFHLRDKLEATGPLVSPLIAADSGKTTATGLSFGVSYSTFDREQLPSSGFRLGGNIASAFAGDREWVSVAVDAGAAYPIGPAVLAIRAEAGVIEGRNGQNVGILDRAFLGGDAPRGFAFAGIGPRDVTAGGVDSALGGNSYLSASVEVRTPTPLDNVTLGAFVDAGSVWGLDVTAGGASGVIDDSRSLRTSAGVSVYWETRIGLIQVNLAKPLQKES